MQAVSFQSPVYASPAFASGRSQSVKPAVQAMPQCQFGGGKVPSTSLIRRFFNAVGDFLLQAWSAIRLTFKKTEAEQFTHDHEIGHMVSAYASGVRPLVVSFKENATQIVNSFEPIRLRLVG